MMMLSDFSSYPQDVVVLVVDNDEQADGTCFYCH